MTSTIARWYLVQTKPRQEERAKEHLERQSFECYWPQKPQANGEAKRKGSESLFPGYLFIRLDHLQDNWYPIRSTRGVNQIVSFGGNPVPVDDELIDNLRHRLDNLAEKPPLQLEPGEKVRLKLSVLDAVEAIFVCPDGEERSVILLTLLQREQRISVKNDQLASYQRS
ncbi:transcription/translation regulatory transformer protein RfaH [Stutzerimonas tarimensis]|uniref:Transcription/translation regulatory transformer protein RfaH n=1 Tax=Stutzerimonas tarimensis TaxID=1507735 RepID=A0ABV7T541_9GAMM